MLSDPSEEARVAGRKESSNEVSGRLQAARPQPDSAMLLPDRSLDYQRHGYYDQKWNRNAHPSGINKEPPKGLLLRTF